MQLYSSDLSPYSARVRMQIHHKNLPIEILPPPGGLGSAQLKAMNPTGRIPVLDLGDTTLAESWAIMEFLEARFPNPSMLASDPVALARQRELVRFYDLHLAPTIFPMFRALRGTANADAVAEALKSLQVQLQALDQFVVRRGAAPFDLTDIALLPILWYSRALARHFGQPDCIAGFPAIVAWWKHASAVPAAAKVLAEMERALRTAMPALFQNAQGSS